MRGLLLLAITLVILAGAGCAKKENAGSSSADNATPSTQSAAPAGVNAGAEAEGENERVDVTGTVPQLMTRVHDQEAQLDQVIKAAKLADVHKHAFAIRDLVVAAAGQTRLVTAAQKSELESHVAKV